ncbi:MAG: DUF1015 domain-containing protein, partial [Planctomycetota bacterium]
MARIFPFRGWLYNRDKVGSYDQVLAQPYDKIDEAMQKAYHERSPYNIVRVAKGLDEPGDGPSRNRYTRAGETLKKWIHEQVLVQDGKPAIYAYHQVYKVDEKERTRKGFIAVARLEDPGKGGVHAHEHTLAKPKQDRFQLINAVGATEGQIFMLYDDPDRVVNGILDGETLRPPDIEAKDDFGETHRLWRVTDEKRIRDVQREMERKELFIADGHHRYEVALMYRDEMRKRGTRCGGEETFENRMMTFVAMDDAGLTVLPTHRLLRGLEGFSAEKLRTALEKDFRVDEYTFVDDVDEKRTRRDLMEDLKVEGMGGHAFGVVLPGRNVYWLAALRDEKVMDAAVKEKHAPEWKRLDVVILHTLVIEGALGVSKEAVANEKNVSYARHAEEVVEAAKKGECQVAFLLNPTKIEQVRKLASLGEKMPQKSTDFYPKLLTGIVINKYNFEKG